MAAAMPATPVVAPLPDVVVVACQEADLAVRPTSPRMRDGAAAFNEAESLVPSHLRDVVKPKPLERPQPSSDAFDSILININGVFISRPYFSPMGYYSDTKVMERSSNSSCNGVFGKSYFHYIFSRSSIFA
jgi:hypothetical protein